MRQVRVGAPKNCRRFMLPAFLLSWLLDTMASAATMEANRNACAIPRPRRATLGGWGRWPLGESDVYRPEKRAELVAVVTADSHHVIARGAGRAYGDAALNTGHCVLDMQRLDRMLGFDRDTGILRCEAGTTVTDIVEVFLPRGFFAPVTPGTRFVTMGGAIAADVHGKNHHRVGSLASHLLWFDLMLASGEVRRCSRDENPELFWATVGGMGLTGVVVELALKLSPVESAYIDGARMRARNLDEAFEKFEHADRAYEYSVAWIDCLSIKGALGRSVLSVGNFAARDALAPALRQAPLRVKPKGRVAVPFNLPNFALGPATVRAFNHVYYRTHREAARTVTDYESFFYPLDSIHDWNRIYGRRGFVQYQCVWPEADSRAGLIEALEAISQSGRGSFLAVLKKFGPQEGMLSFPMKGYTLALDFPLSPGLLGFLDRLDEMVLKRGGRVYLAKDARMKREALDAMYPKLGEWREIKARVDPNNRFSSTLARRLGLAPA